MSLGVGVWVVFCVVVSPVLGASIPVVSKLVLRGPAAEPPKMHIHHLAPMQNNNVVNNPCSCGVVGLDGALGLGPSHIYEGLAVWNHFACSDEEGSIDYQLSLVLHRGMQSHRLPWGTWRKLDKGP